MTSTEFITKSPAGTQRVATHLAEAICRTRHNAAIVIALEGELGAGKTTFVQGFARVLGVKENVLSPTFVLIKIYKLPTTNYKLKHLVHIDCYRLDSPKDILHLGLREFLKDKDAVVLIEWANRICKLVPRGAFLVRFKHRNKPNERMLQISNF